MTWRSKYKGNNTLFITFRIVPCRITFIETNVPMSNKTDIWMIEYDPAFLKLRYGQQEVVKYEFKSRDHLQCLPSLGNKTLIGVSFQSTNTLKVLLHSDLNSTDNGKGSSIKDVRKEGGGGSIKGGRPQKNFEES